jgi:hypothetical protein
MEPWLYAVRHIAHGMTGPALATGGGGFDSHTGGNPGRVFAHNDRYWLRSDSSTLTAWKNIPAGIRRLCAGAAVSRPLDGQSIIFRNSLGQDLLSVDNSGGFIRIRRGATVLETTTTAGGGIYYLELIGECNGAGSYYEVRKDGQVIASATDDTGNADIRFVAFHMPGNAFNSSDSADWYVKEWEDSTTPVPFGPIVSIWQPAAADVGTQEWTPDSGTDNYARIGRRHGEAPTGGNVTSDTLGDIDRYSFAALPSNVNSILAMTYVTFSYAPDGGAPLIRVDAENSTGTDTSVAASQVVGVVGPRTQMFPHFTAPDGGVLTVAKVNDAYAKLIAVA